MKRKEYNVVMNMNTYKVCPDEDCIEIDGEKYYGGQSVRVVSKNLLVFSYHYDTQFYGISKETGLEIFKHFLTIRFFLKEYKWAFRTNHTYSELPYSHYSKFYSKRRGFW